MTVWIENPFDNLPCEGGRAMRYWLMAKAFVKAGHRVIYWTSSFSHTGKVMRQLPGTIKLDGIEVRVIPTMPYEKNISLRRIRSHRDYAKKWQELALKPDVPRPDVIIVSTPPLATGEVARHLARHFGAKLVVDIQDAWPETFYQVVPRFMRGMAPLLFAPMVKSVKKLLGAADLVTAVSTRYVERARHLGRADAQLFYHGIDLQNWGKSPIRPVKDEPQLAYIGGLGANYDLMTVLKALEKMPNVKLAIAGAGEQAASLRIYVQCNGLSDRVTFHGYLEDYEIHELLQSAAIGIVPLSESSWVGVPYKFADYTAENLAVLSSLKGETDALLVKYGAGESYEAGSADSFVAAYNRLLPRLTEAREGARHLAEAEFDAQKIYKGYVSLVKGVVGK